MPAAFDHWSHDAILPDGSETSPYVDPFLDIANPWMGIEATFDPNQIPQSEEKSRWCEMSDQAETLKSVLPCRHADFSLESGGVEHRCVVGSQVPPIDLSWTMSPSANSSSMGAPPISPLSTRSQPKGTEGLPRAFTAHSCCECSRKPCQSLQEAALADVKHVLSKYGLSLTDLAAFVADSLELSPDNTLSSRCCKDRTGTAKNPALGASINGRLTRILSEIGDDRLDKIVVLYEKENEQ